MKEEIEKFIQEKKQLLAKVEQIDKFIETYQMLCEHDMKYNGHDSHKDYYVCSICGADEAV